MFCHNKIDFGLYCTPMNRYHIQQKVATLSSIWEDQDFTVEGYSISQWDFNFAQGPLGDAWLITKEIAALTYIDALNEFRVNLFPLLAKAGFISQCEMRYLFESYFITKRNDNDNQVFYFQHLRQI